MKKHFIAIAGNIGVGKTTLTNILSQSFGWNSFIEAAEQNPYLTDFYQDMNRWGFNSQIFFLSMRFRQHLDLNKREETSIQDRTIYEDAEIFACNIYEQKLISERDWQTYRKLYNEMLRVLQPPDLILYLQASIPTLLQRISQRGRDYEQSIPVDYLSLLNIRYDKWATEFTLCPILTIDTTNIDFVNNDKHRNDLIDLVRKNLLGGSL